MRKEILLKRWQLSKLIEDINLAMKDCPKEESFKLTKLKKEKLKEWQFLNELLRVL